MFIGEYSHTIDEKGRLSVPVKFRGDFHGSIVVTRGLDHCLWLFPESAWRQLAERLAKLPLSQKKSRAFARLMLAGAWDSTLDTQGRVAVPEYLRTFANLGKHVTVAGLYSRLEVWNEDAWHTYRAATEAAGEDIAEGMAELGV